MFIINVAFMIFALCSSVVAYLLYRTCDGTLRKRLISYFIAMVWCMLIWAVAYPPQSSLTSNILGLITILPITFAMVRLAVYLYAVCKTPRKSLVETMGHKKQ